MAVKHVTEEWTGPGRGDGVVVPIAPQDNAAHLDDHKLAFEHWYFDARLSDGHVVVGFLQTRELVFRSPGVEIHVYRPDGTRHEVVRRYADRDVRASRESFDVRVGHNHGWFDATLGEHGGYHVQISEGDLALDLEFVAELPGWRPGRGRTSYGENEYFAWAVGAPRARVSGTVRIGQEVVQAEGIGYHDHNWGLGDMKRIVAKWYWGRLYTPEVTLVYADVLTTPGYSASWASPLMLAVGSRIVLSTGDVEVVEGEPVFDRVAQRTYPRTFGLVVPGRLKLGFEVRRIVHAHDLLADVPVLGRRPIRPLLHRLGMRPGYFRFESDFELSVSLDGSTERHTGRTLHEMVALR